MGLNFFGKPYERIIPHEMLRLNAPHPPNQFGSNKFFRKLRLYMSKLESSLISKRSRCLLVVFPASLENVRTCKKETRFSRFFQRELRKRTRNQTKNLCSQNRES